MILLGAKETTISFKEYMGRPYIHVSVPTDNQGRASDFSIYTDRAEVVRNAGDLDMTTGKRYKVTLGIIKVEEI